MALPDLNLLATLDVLLAEGSVARAAEKLQLSPSAMSRALARLRSVTGDPLLVRAGRGLVPTHRAIEMRERVRDLVRDAEAVLRPSANIEIKRLSRSFTLRASDGFVESFGPRLVQRVGEEAPEVQLRFLRKLDKDSAGLRDGSVDLETGLVDAAIGPEVRAQALFRNRYVGVLRSGHPLTRGEMTPALYAAARHVRISRAGLEGGPLDEALKKSGLERNVVTIVDGYAAAMALVRETDLIASVPERHTEGLRNGTSSFALPFQTPEITISLLWHPRHDGDQAHRWLRECVHDALSRRQRRQSTVRPSGEFE